MSDIAKEIRDGLANFYGTEQYHRLGLLHGKVVCTDGVKWLCQKASCFWLMDAIASHQPQALKHEMLRDMQFWTLKVNGSKATLTCDDGNDNIIITQEIEYTDFPLDEIKIWIEPGDVGGKLVYVAMLPSER